MSIDRLKGMCLVLLLGMCSSVLWAQNLDNQVKRIEENQVPLAVRHSFEENLGPLPEGGFWIVQFTVYEQGAMTLAEPKWYAYQKRGRKFRMEARFTPEGKLLSSRGFAMPLEKPS